MTAIDTILNIPGGVDFESAALGMFRFQSVACEPYRRYVELLGIEREKVVKVEQIPFLPVSLFKTQKVYSGEREPEIVFTSSSTGGMEPSKHYMARVADYEKTFTRAFELFYGPASDVNIYALLPNYLEKEGSSLVYMAERLIAPGRGGGFYLGDYGKLIADMEADGGKKILLGVSYALWDLAERYAPKLENTIVMETGGMKGRREELTKGEFHEILKNGFGVERIHSEYGMAELTSQGYSDGGGVFRCPPWMKVLTRDLNDPVDVRDGASTGGVNIVDLANISSCAFIRTQDVGTVYPDGSFSIAGRADRSEIRGCNLLVQ